MIRISLKQYLCLLLIASLLCIHPVFAGDAGRLPLDNNCDGIISADELSPSILSYLKDKYLCPGGSQSPDADLSDAAYIYTYWNKRPKTVHDSSGQTITLYRPIKKAVIMNGETLETMRSLGFKENNVVGVGKYVLDDELFFPEYSSKADIGSVWSPDYEKIISLSPDAVFIYSGFMEEKSDEIQEKIQSMDPSIKVFRFDLYNPSDYIHEAEMLSKIINREDEWNRLANFYSKQMKSIESIIENIPKEDRVQVYFESWDDYKSCAKGSGFNEKINMAGGISIFEDTTPEYPVVNPESVLIKNPEVVVKLIGSGILKFGGYEDNDYSKAEQVCRTLTKREGWCELKSVKDNRIHILSNDIFGGPEYIIGILYLAKWFYPKEFEEINPEVVHQEYITRFQHLNFNVSCEGIFTYPKKEQV